MNILDHNNNQASVPGMHATNMYIYYFNAELTLSLSLLLDQVHENYISKFNTYLAKPSKIEKKNYSTEQKTKRRNIYCLAIAIIIIIINIPS